MADAKVPQRDEVRGMLASLADGAVSREDASRWASHYLLRSREPNDWSLWKAIDAIGSADLTTTDRLYLYGPEDFIAWLEEFDRAGD